MIVCCMIVYVCACMLFVDQILRLFVVRSLSCSMSLVSIICLYVFVSLFDRRLVGGLPVSLSLLLDRRFVGMRRISSSLHAATSEGGRARPTVQSEV